MEKAQKIQEIKDGISAYKHEQTVLLRLLRRYKRMTQDEFDKLFRDRDNKKGINPFGLGPPGGIDGDSFLLGLGANGNNEWGWWLDLMQHMALVGLIDAVTEDGVIVYSYIKGLE